MVKSKYETARCRDAASAFFVAKSLSEVFAYFHAVAVTVECGIYCLACQGVFFMNNPLK
jgi:hypothetical protein